MNTTEIGNRIHTARMLRNVTLDDIANDIGVAKSTIQRYEKGLITNPKIPVLHAIANALKVNPAWIVLKTDQMIEDERNEPAPSASSNTKKGVVIPVLGFVAAGIPIEAIEDVIDTEEIPQEMAATGKFFGLKIKGNSMEPRIKDGDIVIVRQQEDAESGDIVIACVNGDEATCKRLRKYKDGIELISNNPSYDPMFFSNQEIAERPVTILGRVVELRAKL